MKRTIPAILALVIIISIIPISDVIIKNKLSSKENVTKAIYYNNIFTRNNSDFILDRVITDNSIVVLGSSELAYFDSYSFPKNLYNNGNSDYNSIIMGAGYLQSLAQTINIGSLDNNMKKRKVVLIVSPQWFTPAGINSKAFSSRFEEANFIEFLKNKKIPNEIKTAVTKRTKELLKDDQNTLKRIKKYENIYLLHKFDIVDFTYNTIYNSFMDYKIRFKLQNELSKIKSPLNSEIVKAEKIDFDTLLIDEEQAGKASTSTNEYGIENGYFKKYIENKLENSKNSKKNESFVKSTEYNDFKLFLETCKKLGIEPLIISVPVNGRWYDYTGFSNIDRSTYYQNIRDICKEYEVKLVDYSDREYELYFLKDVMHLGWKGWAYLNKDIYNFYKGEDNYSTVTKSEIKPIEKATTEGVVKSGDNSYSFSGTYDDLSKNSIIFKLKENNNIIDISMKTGDRSAIFLNTADSGKYTLNVSSKTDLGLNSLDIEYQLEKDSVYKIEYSVEQINNFKVDIKNIRLSKIDY